MRSNYEILRNAVDKDGEPPTIIRVPEPEPRVATYNYDAMTSGEKAWFEGVRPGEQVEFYLPAKYLNFIIANDVVVTAELSGPCRPPSFAETYAAAHDALARAFSGRKIVQVGVEPLLRDGAGLHCHSRNQPCRMI